MEMLGPVVQDVQCIRGEMYLLRSAPEAEFFQGGVNSRLSASEAGASEAGASEPSAFHQSESELSASEAEGRECFRS
jgi:hypothetical protein